MMVRSAPAVVAAVGLLLAEILSAAATVATARQGVALPAQERICIKLSRSPPGTSSGASQDPP